ncbi:MAG: NF038120 family PEP-CTERM protein [Massilia sp.]
MTYFAKSLKRSSGNFIKQVVMAAAITASSVASAGVLNFEGPNSLGDSPFLVGNGAYQFSNGFTVQTATVDNSDGNLAGMLIDGSDNGLCYLACPVNNKTNYLAMLDDSYLFIYMTNGDKFKMTGLSASFIGASDSYQAVAGLLVLQGFSFTTGAVGSARQVALSGPNSAGNFNFADFDLGSFGNNAVDYVRILGYGACDAAGNCNRSSGLANYALDNITTRSLPEPGSLALFGLAAFGIAAARRRAA